MEYYIDSLNTKLEYDRLESIKPDIIELICLIENKDAKNKNDIIRFLIVFNSKLKEKLHIIKKENKKILEEEGKNNKYRENTKNINTLKDIINYIEVGLENYDFRLELPSLEYNYAYNIVNNIKDLDFYSAIIEKYPQMLNCKDNLGNSLLYNMVKNYLDNYDPYYLKVICTMLENKNINISSIEINSIYDDISDALNEKYANTNALKRIKFIMDHYFENNKILQNRINTLNIDKPKVSMPVSEPLDRCDYIDRENLKALYTFNINNSHECISIEETNKGTNIYINTPDISSLVKNDSIEDKIASSIVYGHLFNNEFIKKYSDFKVGEPRLAISLKLEYDTNGKFKRSKVIESIIVNKKNLSEEDIDTIKVRELLKTDEPLKDYLNEYITELVKELNVPMIYEKHHTLSDIEKQNLYTSITRFTNKYFKKYKNYAIELLKSYKTIPNKCDYNNNDGVVKITDATNNYISLENLRLLKKYLLDKKEEINIEEEMIIASTIKK